MTLVGQMVIASLEVISHPVFGVPLCAVYVLMFLGLTSRRRPVFRNCGLAVNQNVDVPHTRGACPLCNLRLRPMYVLDPSLHRSLLDAAGAADAKVSQ